VNKPIKLAADDFDYIHWKKDSGQEIETFELMIYGKSELHCEKIKQQILNNQKKAEKYDEYANCCQHSDDEYCIWFHELHKEDKQVDQLKEKLGKIKIIFDDESIDDDTFFPKLEEILGDKS